MEDGSSGGYGDVDFSSPGEYRVVRITKNESEDQVHTEQKVCDFDLIPVLNAE